MTAPARGAAAAGAELVFLSLGGAGEIGMNLSLYGYGPPGEHTWVMVDLGITFNEGSQPGADVILPNPAFIAERRDRLAALVLTHAHEDHLGAVPYLWSRLACPVYATPFTAAVLRRKLIETSLEDRVPLTVVPLGARFTVGPFEMEMITLTHSIPEPNAIAIRTPLGTVLHTGDWKFDPDPVVGPAADEAALARLGQRGVLATVCDSTNAFVAGSAGSEADLLAPLTELIAGCKGRVAVACFASNVARLETIAAAARANDRDVVVAGRSLRRIEAAARETGYLARVAPFIDEADCGHLPRDRVVIICTGSQGEPRAALARIAVGEHPNVTLGTGDTVIFSSRIIPGNEKAVAVIHNGLARLGVEVVTWQDHRVHVSGHPARDELARMYALSRPRIAVPVHGERRHLEAHARLAIACQVPEVVVAENGTLVRLAPGPAAAIDTVPAGRLYLDGDRLVAGDGDLFRSRIGVLYNGAAVVTVTLDRGDLAAAPEITTFGLLDAGEESVLESARAAAGKAIMDLGKRMAADDEAVREAVRVAVRRAFRAAIGKKPITRVHVVRLTREARSP